VRDYATQAPQVMFMRYVVSVNQPFKAPTFLLLAQIACRDGSLDRSPWWSAKAIEFSDNVWLAGFGRHL